jgi:hypothetical protein
VSSALQALLLLASAGVFGVLLLLNMLIKTLARREKVGFIDVFLVFVTVALLVLALVFDYQASPAGQPLVQMGTLGAAAVLGVFGLLIMLLEVFRPQRLRDSRGLLVLWAALLVAISTQTVPLIARNIAPTLESLSLVAAPTPTRAVSEATADPNAVELVTATRRPVTPTASPTPTTPATATQTATPRPSATPTSTREPYVYSSPTPLPSPTLPTPCVGTLPYNIRLRAEPDAEAETLATIPFGTTIAIYGKDGTTAAWWYTEYEDTYGWVDAEFVQTVGCEAIPVRG